MFAAAVVLAVSAQGWDALFQANGGGQVEITWEGGRTKVHVLLRTLKAGKVRVPISLPGRFVILQREDALSLRTERGRPAEFARVKGDVELKAGGYVELVSKKRFVHVRFSDDFTRGAGEASVWEAHSGEMKVLSEPHPERSACAFKLEKKNEGAALSVTGYRAWADYLFSAAVRPAPGARAGLAASIRGGDCLLFRAGERGCELVKVEKGAETVLARSPARTRPGSWHLMSLACTLLRTVGYIDGRAIVSHDTPSSGKVGLWADGPAGVLFDDVEVSGLSDRSPERVLREILFDRRGSASSLASRDAGMREWTGRAWAWEGELSRMTHYGSSRVRLSFPEPPRSGKAELGVFSAHGSPAYVLSAAFGEQGARLDLRKGAISVWKGDGGKSVALRAEEKTVSVDVDGKELVSCPAGRPGKGRAFFLTDASGGTLELSSLNELDLYFDRSPVEWLPLAGEWGVRSLWDCDPRWTWYSGTTRADERIAWNWLKFPVSGDFELKAVLGVRMLGDQTPYYQYPANVCFAFSPEKGEPLVFVAGTADLPWRIFRGRKVLAEWSEMHHPDARASFGDMNKLFHTSWYEIQLGRTGLKTWMKARYLPIKENRKYKRLESARFECPAPSGRLLLGVGVVDNAFVMPRLTLSAEKWHDARDEYPSPPDLLPLVYRDGTEFARVLGRVIAAPKKPSRRPGPSRLHEAFREAYGKRLVYEDFEDACWEGRVGGHDGCCLFLDDDAHTGKKCLLVASAGIGGRFELPLARGAFPTRSYPGLRFALRVPPRTALGLRVVADGRVREYSLTDPRFTPSISSVRADDGWQVVDVDLEKMLGDRVVSYVALEDPGWQESVRGDYYRLDAFAFVARLPREGERTAAGVSFFADRAKGELVLGGVRIPAVFGGTTGDVTQVKPEIVGLGAHDCPERVEIELGEGGEQALDLATATLSVDGREYTFTEGGLALDGTKLVWENPLDDAWGDGELVQVTFRARTFPVRKVQARARFTCDYSRDRKGPPSPVPVCRHERELFFADFEHGADFAQVANRGGMTVSAVPWRGPDGSTACLAELAPFNTWENYVFLRREAFGVSRYPRLSAYFKGRKGMGVWLGARLSGEVYGIFDAHFKKGRELRQEAQFACDSEWHYVDMDLKGLLSRYPGFPRVEELFFSGRRHGRREHYRAYYFDAARVYSPRGTKLRFEWRAPPDLTGISGYSFALDRSPDTAPPEKILSKEPKAAFENLQPGEYHFHVRARDGAGNWGETSHIPAYLEAPVLNASPVTSSGRRRRR